MKKNNKKYYLIILFIIILINFIIPVYAEELRRESSLTINFITESNTLPMDNVDVLIYKLASYEDESYVAKWQSNYLKYEMDLEKSTDKEIIARAAELADFVKSNNINFDYKVTTNSNGKSDITFQNGIYLICGTETVKNNVKYIPVPCIIELPYFDKEGTAIHDVSIELKYDREELEITPPPTEQSVITPSPSVQTEEPESVLPRTGDIIQIVVGILLLVIVLNAFQILHEKRKKNKNNKD